MKGSKTTRRVGALALLVLSLHILLCIFFVFTPDKFIPRNSFTTIYRNLILLGPFFTESRIVDSHYLSFNYKSGGSWSEERHLTREHFDSYIEAPWRTDQQLAINYERYLLRSMHAASSDYSFDHIKTTKSFRELNSFLINELMSEPADSIKIIYTTDRYLPAMKAFSQDTIFKFVYNPKSIGPVKK